MNSYRIENNKLTYSLERKSYWGIDTTLYQRKSLYQRSCLADHQISTC